MWQKYFVVKQALFDEPLNHIKAHGKWFIFYSDDAEKPGYCAYQVGYRTKELAEKGAKRLHSRIHGEMEQILGITHE